ncbi:ribosome small subunit-dependent GTPase A [Listeria grandensis]|uniref:Small ribosomal subunit biogenesis GTPase RsgA n=1 Tax=Listeria grandensis TaxID=1494963 RepID=A0A7X0Y1L9_9LIST|nr:ribosome small subunit-dependent GTPase A [Listeria grandensis]MBC1935058.1 ribosome small subunit-dependent GTPase A [Listeria grandensis]MBC6314630.1 ribosome small subunit-dependent GTPase A [Listeria grandensis]
MTIINYGFTDFFESQTLQSGLIPARVTAVFKDFFKVVSEDGEHLAKLKHVAFMGAINTELPAVGDFVALESHPRDTSLIHGVLDRKTVFKRSDPAGGEQLVAANFDYVFIVSSLNHDFNMNRLERYLTIAWDSGAKPVVILTKADLSDNVTQIVTEIELVAYGVPIFPVDNLSKRGFEDIEQFLKQGETIVLLGSSGVGKSSFINALSGETLMKTSEIREDDSKGKHTTTHRELHRLSTGLLVIDTPGMRELGIGQASHGLGETFQDIELLANDCKFRNCQHGSEPGCAVQSALEDGSLPETHYSNWLKLKRELAYFERKNDPVLQRAEKQKWKAVHKALETQYKSNLKARKK